MKIVTNTKLIKRNAKIGQFTTLAALGVLGIGLYLTFAKPEKFAYSLACLLFGFFLSQIGIYFGNRWGRSPRPDELINKNMKGLGREYTVYHFSTPASHFLVGPAGLWVILPYYQGGVILYDGKRWRSKGGGFARSYMRIFGQESMGRPELETDTEVQSVKRYLERLLPEGTAVPEIRTGPGRCARGAAEGGEGRGIESAIQRISESGRLFDSLILLTRRIAFMVHLF
jgi:hypothetical protein